MMIPRVKQPKGRGYQSALRKFGPKIF